MGGGEEGEGRMGEEGEEGEGREELENFFWVGISGKKRYDRVRCGEGRGDGGGEGGGEEGERGR